MIGLKIQSLDNKKVTENEREYLITLEMLKKGIKIPKKQKQFGMGANENVGFRHNRPGKLNLPICLFLYVLNDSNLNHRNQKDHNDYKATQAC